MTASTRDLPAPSAGLVAKRRSKRPRPELLIGLVALLAVVAVVGGVYFLRPKPAPVMKTQALVRKTLVAVVTATGTVNPKQTINVGTQVSGTIQTIVADYNDPVRKGQILARLDPTLLQASLTAARGTLAQARAQWQAALANAAGATSTKAAALATADADNQQAQVVQEAMTSADATIVKSRASLELARQTLTRDRALLAPGFIAQNQYDTDYANQVAADTALSGAIVVARQARLQLAAARSTAMAGTAAGSAAAFGATGFARTAAADLAAIDAAAALVTTASVNLKNTVITSPVNGTVIARNVSIGQTVAASFQTPTLYTIAENLAQMQIGRVSATGARSSLSVADGLAIVKLPGVDAVSPVVTVHAQVIGGGNNWNTSIAGVAPTYGHIRTWGLTAGTFFSQRDVTTAAKVSILGTTVIKNLFPAGGSALGQRIRILNVPFTVVGILASRGQSGFGQDQDDTILVPYTSLMQRLTGQTYVNWLMISVIDADSLAQTQQDVTALLEQRHRIVPPQPDDFSTRNLQDIAAAAAATASVMQLLLAGVAAVSLLVGGIGIMNIMLVSVTERTRQIGLRMAVGARSRAILEQFLAESLVLSTGGGLLGVIAGTLVTLVVALFAHWPMIVSPMAVLASVGFSALVGVFFGYYPALKASRLNPIDALRFE